MLSLFFSFAIVASELKVASWQRGKAVKKAEGLFLETVYETKGSCF